MITVKKNNKLYEVLDLDADSYATDYLLREILPGTKRAIGQKFWADSKEFESMSTNTVQLVAPRLSEPYRPDYPDFNYPVVPLKTR